MWQYLFFNRQARIVCILNQKPSANTQVSPNIYLDDLSYVMCKHTSVKWTYNVMRDESAQSVISLQINESLIPISPRCVSRDAEPDQVLPRAPITPGATLITGTERG